MCGCYQLICQNCFCFVYRASVGPLGIASVGHIPNRCHANCQLKRQPSVPLCPSRAASQRRSITASHHYITHYQEQAAMILITIFMYFLFWQDAVTLKATNASPSTSSTLPGIPPSPASGIVWRCLGCKYPVAID